MTSHFSSISKHLHHDSDEHSGTESPAATHEFNLNDCTSVEYLRHFRVADLKQLLNARGLSSTGKKEDLVLRMWEWVQAEEALREDEEQVPAQQSSAAPPVHSPRCDSKLVEGKPPAVKEANVSDNIKSPVAPKNEGKITNASDESTSTTSSTVSLSSSSHGDLAELKLEERAERFISPQEFKRRQRAARFGLELKEELSDDSGPVAKKARNFISGEGDDSLPRESRDPVAPVLMNTEQLERVRARMERFGQKAEATPVHASGEQVLQRRVDRFGSADATASS